MTTQVLPEGPENAKVLIVGEAPGAQEIIHGKPFVGASGDFLNDALEEVGLSRSQCFITNLARERPKNNDISIWVAKSKKQEAEWIKDGSGHQLLGKVVKLPVIEGWHLLQKELELVQPNVIIALGNLSMWALTSKWGIQTWRGSQLKSHSGLKVIPTYHPAAILRQWSWRPALIADLRRAAREATSKEYSVVERNLLIAPTFNEVVAVLASLREMLSKGTVKLSVDIETSPGKLNCIGVAWNSLEALCIPLTCSAGHYWQEHEEAEILWMLYLVLTHSKAQIIGQNFSYDAQWIERYWKFLPLVQWDTMITQHAIFSAQQKSLDYLASIYCTNYQQWKGAIKWTEGKDDA